MILTESTEVHRSSWLASKPGIDYSETLRRKPKSDKGAKTATSIQDPFDNIESESELDNESTTEDRPEDAPDILRQVEEAGRLFRTMGTQDEAFPECLKGQYGEDPSFKPILENPENFLNFKIKDGLIFFRSEGTLRLAISNVKLGNQLVREMIVRHGHSMLAHLGGYKTLIYLRDQVWWKTMAQDITDYCKSCQMCATSKSPTEKPHGLLKMMPVPTHPWQYIGIDFVGPLPKSTNQNGAFDMICVIIDLLTVMVHLVLTRQNYKAVDMAEVIFDMVYKLHGLPERIISDRDSLFTSHFWKKLHALLNVELQLLSAFHPQTDGATEQANWTMTQMLRQCVSPKQKDWASKLPAIEFAMNSAQSSTTSFTPFYLNYGRNPSLMIWKGEEVYPGVRQFTENMKEAIMSTHDAIITSRVQQMVQANRKRLVANYKEGDLVYLSTKNISLPKGRARKLALKYLGPFPITKVLKEGATYQLDLSDELTKRGVNRAFHASLLRPHVPNYDRRFPGRLPIQIPGFGEKPDEWIVDSIITHHGKGQGSEFQILWKAGDKTWVTYREVVHLNALDRYCELMGVKSATNLPPNYVNMDSESENEDIEVKACVLLYKDKRPSGTTEGNNNSPSTMSSRFVSPALNNNPINEFSDHDLRQCGYYEAALCAYHMGIAQYPRERQPDQWPEYIKWMHGNANAQ